MPVYIVAITMCVDCVCSYKFGMVHCYMIQLVTHVNSYLHFVPHWIELFVLCWFSLDFLIGNFCNTQQGFLWKFCTCNNYCSLLNLESLIKLSVVMVCLYMYLHLLLFYIGGWYFLNLLSAVWKTTKNFILSDVLFTTWFIFQPIFLHQHIT